MDILFQQIINGLVQGSVYALVALGYTMVYGILGLINFAHGEVVMIGAMIALTVLQSLLATAVAPVLAVLVSLLAAMAVCMALGYTIERVAYRPLRNAPRLAPLITAIGVSIVLQNLAMMIWGREYHSFPLPFDNASHQLGGAIVNDVQIGIVVIALVIMAGLMWLVHQTRMGRAMRAVAENPAAATLMGVDINSVISFTFMLGSALAAIAGFMVSANYGIVHYYMGFMLGLKAFTAAVLGGIGNLRGAMVGGVLLGLIESLGAGYIGDLTGGFLGSNYQDVFAFFVLIAVLIFRPSGLLGEKLAERA
ncbi:branched-chain amino acid ABC transporter permease [Sideroxydans lithotrophicus]|uniref:branched-chain amino acid ABC transporter permease n=1 Tax=Sideroxydans lithotrophicus TaxID=63745 RepID=UPI00059B69D1|nr:branched-chain amino acid ABC transporter permease [Sideroxydans lithotrophicus]